MRRHSWIALLALIAVGCRQEEAGKTNEANERITTASNLAIQPQLVVDHPSGLDFGDFPGPVYASDEDIFDDTQSVTREEADGVTTWTYSYKTRGSVGLLMRFYETNMGDFESWSHGAMDSLTGTNRHGDAVEVFAGFIGGENIGDDRVNLGERRDFYHAVTVTIVRTDGQAVPDFPEYDPNDPIITFYDIVQLGETTIGRPEPLSFLTLDEFQAPLLGSDGDIFDRDTTYTIVWNEEETSVVSTTLSYKTTASFETYKAFYEDELIDATSGVENEVPYVRGLSTDARRVEVRYDSENSYRTRLKPGEAIVSVEISGE